MDNFEFISDNRFRIILDRDYNELIKCFDSGCYKSVLILSGSIIESVLVEYFLNNPPDGYTQKRILNMSLGDLIELAKEKELIDAKIMSLSAVVKNYRNLIHPGREVRLKEQFDKETANVSISLVRLILKDIKSNYLEKYGYSAKELIQKIINDSVSIGIFEELVKKLSYPEKLKLLNNLVEIEMDNEFHPIDNPKQYVDILKPQINKDDLTKQVLFLHKKVETGEKWEILILMGLFQEDLNLIENEKLDLILKYCTSVLNETKNLSDIKNLRTWRVFSNLSKYIESSTILEDFKKMLVPYYWGSKSYDEVEYLYYQLTAKISQKTKEQFEFEFELSESSYKKGRFIDDVDDTLPF